MSDLIIKSFFDNCAGRTIERLKLAYNIEGLVEELTLLTASHFDGGKIRGKKILIKPNWVTHSRNEADDLCLRTNDNFLLAVLEIILRKQPGQVIVGDAPIQGCNWDKMISRSLINSITGLSQKYNVQVIIKDFRRVTFDPAKNNPEKKVISFSDYVIFNLGKKSHLEEITRYGNNRFRVAQYNPNKLAESHRPGVHKYCIIRDIFDSDVVINLPKVKTHQKTGITCAIKNLVGLNGDKDFLPHYRIGGKSKGGDSYPGGGLLEYYSELALDMANRKQGTQLYWFWVHVSSLLWRLSPSGEKGSYGGAWHGNDTTWRMVLDINNIAKFGNTEGTISETAQRGIINLCDGIIGGQGDGPLKPDPLPLGIVAISEDPFIMDFVMSLLMGFDPDLLPLVKNGIEMGKVDNTKIVLDGKKIEYTDLSLLSANALPAPGWIEYLKSADKK